MLNKIEVEGFRSIKSTSFDLAAINVLIGANGSGKSNFIEAFAFLQAITEGRLKKYVQKAGGADRILHFGSKHTEEIRLRVHFDDSVNQYEIKLTVSELDELFPDNETSYFWNKNKYATPYSTNLSNNGAEAAISSSEQQGVNKHVKNALESLRLYHFHDTGDSSPMKKVSNIDDNAYLRTDGSNIASFLYFLKTKHKPSYEIIRNTIRQMAPFFDDFILKPRRLDGDLIRLEWLHKSSDKYFDVSSFSDGTLRFILLVTLLLQPAEYRPAVILLDEPELGLHPFAITLLGAMIKSISFDSQIVISTQSPFLLDQFDPNNVVIVDRLGEASNFQRLKEEPLKEWLEDYSLGQLWEKNEIGGRPSGF